MPFGQPLSSLSTDHLEGQIMGTQLAADAIDGKVITGALIRTAPAGARVEVGSSSATPDVAARLFSGSPIERTAGFLRQLLEVFTSGFQQGSQASTILSTADLGGGAAVLTLTSARVKSDGTSKTRARFAQLDVDGLNVTGAVSTTGDVNGLIAGWAGSVLITPTALNTPTSVTVQLPPGRFARNPVVVATPATGVPQNVSVGVGAITTDAAGLPTAVTITLTRSDSLTGTGVRVMALDTL